jgi:CRP/FNR family transcriptional regulator, cyclic AMP receptor protein
MTRRPASDAIYGDMNQHETAPAQGFWALLTDEERDVLFSLGRVTTFPSSGVICVEGDPATHVFVLLGGLAKVLTSTADGHELTIALRGNGDLVGELAGETTGYRNATVRAIGTVRALIVAYERFSSFLDAHPGAGHAYRHVVTHRWNDADSMLRSHPVTNGAHRLAIVLINLATRYGSETEQGVHIAVPLSQDELASLAGASRATVTRALSNWRRRGIIRTGQRDITITGLKDLRKIAGHQA